MNLLVYLKVQTEETKGATMANVSRLILARERKSSRGQYTKRRDLDCHSQMMQRTFEDHRNRTVRANEPEFKKDSLQQSIDV